MTYALSSVFSWALSNGLRVNTKKRLSGRDSLPVDAPGVVELEIVTLGGKATATPALKGNDHVFFVLNFGLSLLATRCLSRGTYCSK